MSAAEKLRALDEAATPGPWTTREGRFLVLPTRASGERFTTLLHDRENAEATATLRNALPQLLAVVEAAEEVMARRPETSRPIPAALAALDEALS